MKQLLIIILLLSMNLSIAAETQVVSAKHGMVVSEQHLASQIGASILKSGGNAIDAAVAVGYALAVVNPCCGNIGGGGFMTIHLAKGKNIFLNFRERASLAAKPNMFLDSDGNIIPDLSTVGYLAVAVPGTVLGLETALKQYGTMTRQQVMAPAIALAERGYVLTKGDVQLLSEHTSDFKKQSNVAAIFLRKNNLPYRVGDRLVQKDLANTLKLISEKGPAIFYKGNIAKDIVTASKKHGGILTLQDFATYSVKEMKPITCLYLNYDVISAPPPSSGGATLCEILNILENYPLKSYGYHSARSTHYIVEAMRYAYFDRNNKLGDPDFVDNPVSQLISKDYADQLRQRILDVKATPSSELGEKPAAQEGVNTTHYSVMDAKGNAVSVTYTLNSFFGAKVIAGKTGFFLNNEMDDFAIKSGSANQFGLVQREKNAIQPGKQPLSSMAPTIITLDKKVVMVLGSPGGSRIITSTLLTILNTLDYGMKIQDAVDAPRFHHQWLPDVIEMEPQAFSTEAINELETMGYSFNSVNSWGAVEAIYVDPKTKMIYGANDRRRSAGKAVGY
jgi:gamma-glutamyltranspeptidase/glutathione hydrolase